MLNIYQKQLDMCGCSQHDFEDTFWIFEGLSHREIARVIIATYLEIGDNHHSIYWLYLRELSPTFITEVGQQALNHILETQNVSAQRLEFLKSRSGINAMFYLWDLLDPYPDEMIESMILEQEESHPGARDFILSARGF